jgi:hypothetical protein
MKANPALLAFVSEELGGTLEVMLIVLWPCLFFVG